MTTLQKRLPSGQWSQIMQFGTVLKDGNVEEPTVTVDPPPGDPELQSSQYLTARGIANWNTAHGWGNHAQAGYASESFPVANPSDWAEPAPATLAEAINRLAAAVRQMTGNPV